MQDREKKLAILLTLVVGVWMGRPLVERMFLAPVRAARQEQAQARAQFNVKSDEEFQLLVAQQQLFDWRGQSLPPDPSTAQRVYKEWLMDLAAPSGFTTPEPTLPSIGTRSRGADFVQVPVGLEAKATFDQLATFLFHFHRVNLLHRIDSLDIESPGPDGQPILSVQLTAKGLALSDIEDRLRLFPRALLAQPASREQTTLTVKEAETFPTGEFLAMVDRELIRVVQTAGTTWTVERGAEDTLPADHELDAPVDLFPLREREADEPQSLADFRSLLENNPFTLPAPPVRDSPRLRPDGLQTVTRGQPWEVTVEVADWNPTGGPPRFRLEGDIPAGMTIDESSGEWVWVPAGDEPVGTREVTVWAESPVIATQQVSIRVPVKLRDPNLPPEVEEISAQTAYSGQPFTLEIEAKDPDGGSEPLTFKLTGDVPTSATIDAEGQIAWTPPPELDLGDYEFNVSITDQGDPAQTVAVKVPVTLAEDDARHTYLTTYFQVGEEMKAQLYNRVTNRSQTLTLGSAVKAADLEAEVIRIEPQYILLRNGPETFRLDMGQNLRSLRPAEAADAATARTH